MNNSILLKSIAILVAIYAVLGFSDAILLHLWKYQLYKNKDTRKEHLLHSIRAVIFPIVVLGLLVFQLEGFYLYGFLLILIFDLGFQIWDMWIEKEARTRFGGLSSLEYTIHGLLIFIHSAFLVLYVIKSFHKDHFFRSDGNIFLNENSFATMIAWNLLPGACLIILLHFVLLHPYFSKDHDWEKKFLFKIHIPGLN
ncbi:MAG: hypothetical protein GW761_01525 [Leptospira sp.]|nr:hypothetical protein [Leptospira sp.]